MSFDFNIFPNLKTERLYLQEATLIDVNDVFDLRSSKEINQLVGTKRMKKIEEAVSFIQTCTKLYQEKKRIFWLIHFQNEIIGSIVLHKISLESNYAEIGYKLKPKFQKKGLMSEAMCKVIQFAKENLNLKTIEAFTHKNNKVSFALLKKHNFVYQPNRKCKVYNFNTIWKLDVCSY